MTWWMTKDDVGKISESLERVSEWPKGIDRETLLRVLESHENLRDLAIAEDGRTYKYFILGEKGGLPAVVNALELARRECQRIQAIFDFLYVRMCRATISPRVTGHAADRFAVFAVSEKGEFEEADFPQDRDDLRACELTFHCMPDGLRTERVTELLREFRAHVAHLEARRAEDTRSDSLD